MAISFEELVRDSSRFNDNTEIPITIGDQTEKLRIGDIRGQLGNTLSRYESALQTEREQRAALEQTLKALREASPPDSKAHDEPRGPAGAPSEDDLMADPWSKTLLSQVDKRLSAAVEGLRGEHSGFTDTSKKAVAGLTTLLLRLQANQDYGRYKDWPKDYDPAKAFQEASNKGYIDKSTGLPDLGRLYHELTEDQRIESRAKALAEKMFEEQQKAHAEKNQSKFNRLGVPSSVRSKTPKQEKKYATLQEYMMDDANLPTDDEVKAFGGIANAFIR